MARGRYQPSIRAFGVRGDPSLSTLQACCPSGLSPEYAHRQNSDWIFCQREDEAELDVVTARRQVGAGLRGVHALEHLSAGLFSSRHSSLGRSVGKVREGTLSA